MKLYTVLIPEVEYHTLTVAAESEDEALDRANDLFDFFRYGESPEVHEAREGEDVEYATSSFREAPERYYRTIIQVLE